MSTCKRSACPARIENDEQQQHHDAVFNGYCSVSGHGCFSGTERGHMTSNRHRECGFGNCKNKGTRFKSDADARRHWNHEHCIPGEAIITHDRFGNFLGSGDGDGYYSDAA